MNRNAKDNIRGSHRGGDRDPVQSGKELEGKQEDVDPGDLRDRDGICNWKGRGQDAFRSGKDVIQSSKVVICDGEEQSPTVRSRTLS